MKSKLTMRYPSAWHGEMWREGAPFGNGVIGGMVYGGVFKEIVLINHAFCGYIALLSHLRWFPGSGDPG